MRKRAEAEKVVDGVPLKALGSSSTETLPSKISIRMAAGLYFHKELTVIICLRLINWDEFWLEIPLG